MEQVKDEVRRNNYIAQNKINEMFATDQSHSMDLVLFHKGEVICEEGEELDHFYFMVEGKAKIYNTLENGKNLLICFYQGFGVLGELEFLTDAPYFSNVRAMTDVYCLRMPLTVIRKLFDEDHTFLKHIAVTLATNLKTNTKTSSENLLYPLANRVATYIHLSTSGPVFQENLTLVAEQLGASYRHFQRISAQFCNQGILTKEESGYRITDWEKLEQLVIPQAGGSSAGYIL